MFGGAEEVGGVVEELVEDGLLVGRARALGAGLAHVLSQLVQQHPHGNSERVH